MFVLFPSELQWLILSYLQSWQLQGFIMEGKANNMFYTTLSTNPYFRQNFCLNVWGDYMTEDYIIKILSKTPWLCHLHFDIMNYSARIGPHLKKLTQLSSLYLYCSNHYMNPELPFSLQQSLRYLLRSNLKILQFQGISTGGKFQNSISVY